jgi:hypothetical protein
MFRKIIEGEINNARVSGEVTDELVARRALKGLDSMEKKGVFVDPVDPDPDLVTFFDKLSEISKTRSDALSGSLGNNSTARVKYFFEMNPGRVITNDELIQFAYSGNENIPKSAYTSFGTMIRRARKSLSGKGRIINIPSEGYLYEKKS